MYIKLLCIFMFSFLSIHCRETLTISDDDLLELIKEHEKLIVLFTKEKCDDCKKYEEVVDNLYEDFLVKMHCHAVKIASSYLTRLYSPNKEPCIVFFRHGVPLLYSGEPNENEIYNFIDNNQLPTVKELSDSTFEHLTQAATGATSGDWFVMFHGAACVECQKLHAVWEGVGAILKGRINIARIDAHFAGVNTAKRFKVVTLPTFLFFRRGKLYKFHLPKHDIRTFVSFAQDWYKNARAEIVPLVASPFDNVVDFCATWIKYAVKIGVEFLAENPLVWQIGLGGFGLVAITALIALCCASLSEPIPNIKKDKKSK